MWVPPLPASLGKFLDSCTSVDVRQFSSFTAAEQQKNVVVIFTFMFIKCAAVNDIMSQSAPTMSVRLKLYLETEINLWRNQEVFFIKLVVSALRLLTLFKNREGEGRFGFPPHLWQLWEQSRSPVVSSQSTLCFPCNTLKQPFNFSDSNVFPSWLERWSSQ